MKATLLQQLGLRELEERAFDHAVERFEQARAIAERFTEFGGFRTLCDALLATTALARGDAVGQLLDDVLARFSRLGDVRSQAYTRVYRALDRLRHGRLDAAREDVDAADAILAELGDKWYRAACQGAKAALMALSGELERARELLDEARQGHSDWLVEGLPTLFGVVVSACDPSPPAPAALRDRLREVAATTFLVGAVQAAEQLLETALNRRSAWVVASDGAWFRTPAGERVSLGRRDAPKRLLAALTRARLESPAFD